jgi:toluene monooxygenase electron transfer component
MEHHIDVLAGAERKSFACGDNERLLYAALRAGVELPFGCATGTCGSCRATLASGAVKTMWVQAPGMRAVKRDNDVLTCQCVPTSDCSLDVRTLGAQGVRPVMDRFAGEVSRVERQPDGLAWVEITLDRPLGFLAGQFVLIGVEGIDGHRAYSPATAGLPGRTLSLVVREATQGVMSPRLCAADAAGLNLEVLAPLGVAHVRPETDGDIAMVVGGSGCAVALSVLDWAEATGHLLRHRLDLVCGLRMAVNTAVLQRLSAAARRWPQQLGLTVALSDAEAGVSLTTPATDWPGLRFEAGLAHEVAARCHELPSWKERAVFVAGPDVMVQATLRSLMKLGRISPASVRFDRFS